MSTTIDQRVVEMRFDNAQFERNVSTTLSTLDKLKQKLNFSGASKGLEDVNYAAKNVDMTGLGRAVETVSANFSALQVMGVTALANITNSAVNAGKRIINALTVAPISDGFKEYEMTLNAVQTTMAGTGKTAEEVEKELAKLDEYADKTVYSTSDMLNNLPKFTNAGVELEDATKAMIGIANATALAGGDAGKASIAFYNLGQAIGTGYLTRMDYNSINSAGIATMEWKEQMVEAALAAGTLEKAEGGLYKAGNKTFTMQQLFIDGLQEQWATTDVMMTVFSDYGDETTDIGKKAYSAAQDIKTYTQMMESLKATAGTGWKETWQLVFGGLDAAKEFWTGLSNFISNIITKLADVRNGILESALGKSFTSIGEKINTVLNPATKAADTLKDTVEAVADLGDIVDKVIGGKFGNGVDRFNALTEAGYNWYEVQNKVNETLGNSKRYTQEQIDAQDKLLGTQKETTEKTEEQIDGIVKLSDSQKEMLKRSLKLYAAQKDSNECASEQVAALKEIAEQADKLGMSTDDFIDNLDQINGRWLLINSFKNIGKGLVDTFTVMKEAWKDVFPEHTVENFANKLFDLIAGFHKFTSGIAKAVYHEGKLTDVGDKLMRTFKGIFAVVDLVTTIVGGAFKVAFKVVSTIVKTFGVHIFDVTALIGDAAVKFNEWFDKTLGVSRALEILVPLVKSAAKFVENLINAVKESWWFGELYDNIKGVAGVLGTWVSSLTDSVVGKIGSAFEWLLTLITTVFDKIATWLSSLKKSKVAQETFGAVADSADKVKVVGDVFTKTIEIIQSWIEKIKETEVFKTVAGWFESASTTISDAISAITTKIDNFSVSDFMGHLLTFSDFIGKVATTIGNSKFFLGVVDIIGTAFGKIKDFFTGLVLPEFSIDGLKTFMNNLGLVESKVKSVDGKGIGGAFSALGSYLEQDVLVKNLNKFKNNVIEKFVNFWVKSGDTVKLAFEKLKEIAVAIRDFIFGTKDVKLADILDVTQQFLEILVLLQALKFLRTAVAPVDNITGALDNLAGSLKWEAIGAAFKAMALAIAAFTLCIIVLCGIEDWDKAKQSAIMLGALMIVMGGVVAGVMALTSKLGGGVDAAAAAGSLLMLIGSVFLLVYTLKELDELQLKNPGETIFQLIAIITGLSIGIRSIAKAGGSSFGSVAAILTLVGSLKLILEVIEAYDKFPWSGKQKAIWKMVDMMAVLALAINIATRGVKNGSAAGLASLLLVMVLSLKVLLGVIEDFSNMPFDKMQQGIRGVVELLGTITIMMMIINLTSQPATIEKGQKSVNNFTGLAFALLAMVGAIWILGKMATKDPETLKKGGNAIAQIMAVFTTMLFAIGKSCSGLKMGSVLGIFIGIGALMIVMAGVIKFMETIPWQQSLGSAGALALILVAMAGVLYVLNKSTIDGSNMGKWIGAFAGLAVVVWGLTEILKTLNNVDAEGSIHKVLALSILLATTAGVLYILNKATIDGMNIAKWIGAIAGLGLVAYGLVSVLQALNKVDAEGSIHKVLALSILLGAMGGVLALLNFVKVDGLNTTKWIAALWGMSVIALTLSTVLIALNSVSAEGSIHKVLALSILIAAMAGVLALLNLIKVNVRVIGSMIALAGLLAALHIAVDVLAGMDGLVNARENAITLADFVVVLSLCLAAIAAIGKFLGGGAIVGVVSLAGLMLSLNLIVSVLARMDGIQNAQSNASVLSLLLITMTACLIPLSVIGAFVYPAIVAVVALGIMMAELHILVGVLEKMEGLNNAHVNALVIVTLLSALTNIIVAVGSLGAFDAMAAVAVLRGFVSLVETIGIVAACLGKVTESNSKIEDFINNGLELLKRLARGLGEMISEFGVGLTSGLPEIADNLSGFAQRLLPFVATMLLVNDKIVERAKNLADAIQALITADFMDTLSDLTGGSLVELGTELSDFASELSGFVSGMDAMKPETVTAVETLCSALEALTNANLKDAWTQLLPGDNSLSSFGENIAAFAVSIKDASAALKDITDEDVENIKRSATAGEALADLNASIPSQGGWVQDIIGSKELDTFGPSVVAFADCLIKYSGKVSGQNIDTEAITASATAAQGLADLNNSIPKADGWAQDVLGSQNLSVFGEKIVAFADCLVEYSAKVSGETIDAEAIKTSAGAAEALATLNGKLPSQNGLYQAVVGEKDMGEFGLQLVNFADGIVSYAKAAKELDDDSLKAIEGSGDAIDKLVAVMEKVPDSGGWWDSIVGSADGMAFGDALVSVAEGIRRYCNVALTITESKLTAIDNSGTAIEKLKTAMEKVPETDYSARTSKLSSAITHLVDASNTITILSTGEYDYSGIDSIKTVVADLVSVFTEYDIYDAEYKYIALSRVGNKVVEAADSLSSVTGYNYSGISDFKTAVEKLAEVDVAALVTAFSGKTEDMDSAINDLMSVMSSGLSNGLVTATEAMTSVVDSILSTVTERAPRFRTAAIELMATMASGITFKETSVSDATLAAVAKAILAVKAKKSSMETAGSDFAQGLVNGINNKAPDVYWAAYALGAKAVQGEKDGQKSNSPSKLTMQAGKWFGEGLVIGIERMGNKVYDAGHSLGDTAVDSLSSTVSRIAACIDSDMDVQPTIRPVLDLSNIQSGAGAISGMLGVGSSIGVSTNIGAISTMMTRRGQNGTNADVVCAIDKLRKDIDNLPRETYSIGGVSVNEGTEVADAIKVIARAMKMEGRK